MNSATNGDSQTAFLHWGDVLEADSGACMMPCRVQYPSAHQQQLISALRDLTSSDNSTLSMLLQANSFISDIIALSFADSIDPSAILDTAAAVAASPACQTGFGMYLLVMPVVEALQQLALFSSVSSHVLRILLHNSLLTERCNVGVCMLCSELPRHQK